MTAGRNALLALLVLIGVINFVDRQIIFILLEDIKSDLRLSDTQLGLLSGTLFAIFYGILGIPIARLAERWHRGKIVALSLFVWSAMTVLSGFASSFFALVLARIGVGVGQAGVTPAAHSLIADRFEPGKRATALAIYSLGGTAGIFAALAAGGWLGQNYGWQVAFIAVGIPGMILAPLAMLALRETRDVPQLSASLLRAPAGGSGLAASLHLFWKSLAWRYGAIAAIFTHLASFGIGNWFPSMLQRSFGMSTAEAGLYIAFAVGLAGTVGSLAAGLIADRLAAKHGISWLAWTLAVAFGLATIIAPFVLLAQNQILMLLLLAPYFALMLSGSGVMFALGQATIAPEMRATSSAVIILLINLIGLGIGPTAVGLLSDMLEPRFGTDALRYAMLAFAPLTIGSVICYYLSGKALPDEVTKA